MANIIPQEYSVHLCNYPDLSKAEMRVLWALIHLPHQWNTRQLAGLFGLAQNNISRAIGRLKARKILKGNTRTLLIPKMISSDQNTIQKIDEACPLTTPIDHTLKDWIDNTLTTPYTLYKRTITSNSSVILTIVRITKTNFFFAKAQKKVGCVSHARASARKVAVAPTPINGEVVFRKKSLVETSRKKASSDNGIEVYFTHEADSTFPPRISQPVGRTGSAAGIREHRPAPVHQIRPVSRDNSSSHTNIPKNDSKPSEMKHDPKNSKSLARASSIEQVDEYILQFLRRQLKADNPLYRPYKLKSRQDLTAIATDFYEYYESVGWRVANKPMKNWQMACNRWLRTNLDANRKR